jgi:hypothetical protein
VAEGFKSDSGTRGRGKGLSHDVFGSFVSGYPPELSLEAGLGVTKEVCLSTACAVGLPLTGKGAQLQGNGNFKVGEAERWLEWYRGVPNPAELGRCLNHSLGLFWGQRAKRRLLVPGKDPLAPLRTSSRHWVHRLLGLASCHTSLKHALMARMVPPAMLRMYSSAVLFPMRWLTR